ncbi:hypothetical protein JCM5296_001088 [Sporobolomyces johnsonii]
MPAVLSLEPSILEHIFAYAALYDVKLWVTSPDYATLKSCSLVSKQWRRPAQAVLCWHVRVASPEAMQAIRSRETKRMMAEHETLVLDSTFQWGIDTYWLLDRFPALKAFRIEYDPMRGTHDGQAERDEEWLEWEVLRHPALTGVRNLCCKADFKDPTDITPLMLPLTHLTLGNLPLVHGKALHQAIFSGTTKTLRTISLDFSTEPADKAALDDLIEHFQTTATTLEHLHFLNKPNLNFLMSLHSKMNATKMPHFYSVSYPLLPKALAPFNVLCLACINNGTSLVEFKLVEPASLAALSDEDHEALVLRYLAAFGSRLDSFNIMGRRFRFMFPRQWAAKFVKLPEIAKFLDRAGARGCDVWCGPEQRFDSTAKAMEKRKGKRVAKDGGADDSPAEDVVQQVEQAVLQAAAASSKGKGKGKAKEVNGKGKGKAKEVNGKGKGKDVKGKGKARA